MLFLSSFLPIPLFSALTQYRYIGSAVLCRTCSCLLLLFKDCKGVLSPSFFLLSMGPDLVLREIKKGGMSNVKQSENYKYFCFI